MKLSDVMSAYKDRLSEGSEPVPAAPAGTARLSMEALLTSQPVTTALPKFESPQASGGAGLFGSPQWGGPGLGGLFGSLQGRPGRGDPLDGAEQGSTGLGGPFGIVERGGGGLGGAFGAARQPELGNAGLFGDLQARPTAVVRAGGLGLGEEQDMGDALGLNSDSDDLANPRGRAAASGPGRRTLPSGPRPRSAAPHVVASGGTRVAGALLTGGGESPLTLSGDEETGDEQEPGLGGANPYSALGLLGGESDQEGSEGGSDMSMETTDDGGGSCPSEGGRARGGPEGRIGEPGGRPRLGVSPGLTPRDGDRTSPQHGSSATPRGYLREAPTPGAAFPPFSSLTGSAGAIAVDQSAVVSFATALDEPAHGTPPVAACPQTRPRSVASTTAPQRPGGDPSSPGESLGWRGATKPRPSPLCFVLPQDAVEMESPQVTGGPGWDRGGGTGGRSTAQSTREATPDEGVGNSATPNEPELAAVASVEASAGERHVRSSVATTGKVAAPREQAVGNSSADEPVPCRSPAAASPQGRRGVLTNSFSHALEVARHVAAGFSPRLQRFSSSRSRNPRGFRESEEIEHAIATPSVDLGLALAAAVRVAPGGTPSATSGPASAPTPRPAAAAAGVASPTRPAATEASLADPRAVEPAPENAQAGVLDDSPEEVSARSSLEPTASGGSVSDYVTANPTRAPSASIQSGLATGVDSDSEAEPGDRAEDPTAVRLRDVAAQLGRRAMGDGEVESRPTPSFGSFGSPPRVRRQGGRGRRGQPSGGSPARRPRPAAFALTADPTLDRALGAAAAAAAVAVAARPAVVEPATAELAAAGTGSAGAAASSSAPSPLLPAAKAASIPLGASPSSPQTLAGLPTGVLDPRVPEGPVEAPVLSPRFFGLAAPPRAFAEGPGVPEAEPSLGRLPSEASSEVLPHVSLYGNPTFEEQLRAVNGAAARSAHGAARQAHRRRPSDLGARPGVGAEVSAETIGPLSSRMPSRQDSGLTLPPEEATGQPARGPAPLSTDAGEGAPEDPVDDPAPVDGVADGVVDAAAAAAAEVAPRMAFAVALEGESAGRTLEPPASSTSAVELPEFPAVPTGRPPLASPTAGIASRNELDRDQPVRPPRRPLLEGDMILEAVCELEAEELEEELEQELEDEGMGDDLSEPEGPRDREVAEAALEVREDAGGIEGGPADAPATSRRGTARADAARGPVAAVAGGRPLPEGAAPSRRAAPNLASVPAPRAPGIDSKGSTDYASARSGELAEEAAKRSSSKALSPPLAKAALKMSSLERAVGQAPPPRPRPLQTQQSLTAPLSASLGIPLSGAVGDSFESAPLGAGLGPATADVSASPTGAGPAGPGGVFGAYARSAAGFVGWRAAAARAEGARVGSTAGPGPAACRPGAGGAPPRSAEAEQAADPAPAPSAGARRFVPPAEGERFAAATAPLAPSASPSRTPVSGPEGVASAPPLEVAPDPSSAASSPQRPAPRLHVDVDPRGLPAAYQPRAHPEAFYPPAPQGSLQPSLATDTLSGLPGGLPTAQTVGPLPLDPPPWSRAAREAQARVEGERERYPSVLASQPLGMAPAHSSDANRAGRVPYPEPSADVASPDAKTRLKTQLLEAGRTGGGVTGSGERTGMAGAEEGGDAEGVDGGWEGSPLGARTAAPRARRVYVAEEVEGLVAQALAPYVQELAALKGALAAARREAFDLELEARDLREASEELVNVRAQLVAERRDVSELSTELARLRVALDARRAEPEVGELLAEGRGATAGARGREAGATDSGEGAAPPPPAKRDAPSPAPRRARAIPAGFIDLYASHDDHAYAGPDDDFDADDAYGEGGTLPRPGWARDLDGDLDPPAPRSGKGLGGAHGIVGRGREARRGAHEGARDGPGSRPPSDAESLGRGREPAATGPRSVRAADKPEPPSFRRSAPGGREALGIGAAWVADEPADMVEKWRRMGKGSRPGARPRERRDRLVTAEFLPLGTGAFTLDREDGR